MTKEHMPGKTQRLYTAGTGIGHTKSSGTRWCQSRKTKITPVTQTYTVSLGRRKWPAPWRAPHWQNWFHHAWGLLIPETQTWLEMQFCSRALTSHGLCPQYHRIRMARGWCDELHPIVFVWLVEEPAHTTNGPLGNKEILVILHHHKHQNFWATKFEGSADAICVVMMLIMDQSA